MAAPSLLLALASAGAQGSVRLDRYAINSGEGDIGIVLDSQRYIVNIKPQSPAVAAGVRIGAILERVNDVRTPSVESARAALASGAVYAISTLAGCSGAYQRTECAALPACYWKTSWQEPSVYFPKGQQGAGCLPKSVRFPTPAPSPAPTPVPPTPQPSDAATPAPPLIATPAPTLAAVPITERVLVRDVGPGVSISGGAQEALAGLELDNILVVIGIRPDSPADRGGVRLGMRLTAVNGHAVFTYAEAEAALRWAGRKLVADFALHCSEFSTEAACTSAAVSTGRCRWSGACTGVPVLSFTSAPTPMPMLRAAGERAQPESSESLAPLTVLLLSAVVIAVAAAVGFLLRTLCARRAEREKLLQDGSSDGGDIARAELEARPAEGRLQGLARLLPGQTVRLADPAARGADDGPLAGGSGRLVQMSSTGYAHVQQHGDPNSAKWYSASDLEPAPSALNMLPARRGGSPEVGSNSSLAPVPSAGHGAVSLPAESGDGAEGGDGAESGDGGMECATNSIASDRPPSR